MDNTDTLGKYLKSQRETRHVSLEQVSYATRISVKMLRALEEDRHDELPAPAFVRGYLQAYAKYVEIDAQDLILRYQHHLATEPGAKRATLRSHYLYVKERYQEKRQFFLVLSLFSLLLVSAGGYIVLKAKHERHKHGSPLTAVIAPAPKPGDMNAEKPETTQPPQETNDKQEKKPEVKAEAKKETKKNEIKSAVTPAPALAATPTPPTAATPETAKTTEPAPANDSAPKKYALKLTAIEDAWIKFQADDSEVKELTLRKDKTIFIRANKVIKLFSGNLGALKASFNGEEIKTLVTKDRNKSVVLPSSEAPNYPLPLFPPVKTEAANGAPSTN